MSFSLIARIDGNIRVLLTNATTAQCVSFFTTHVRPEDYDEVAMADENSFERFTLYPVEPDQKGTQRDEEVAFVAQHLSGMSLVQIAEWIVDNAEDRSTLV